MLGRPKKDVPRNLDRITIPTTWLFGRTGDIHNFHPNISFKFKGLGKNQAYNNRQNYLIMI